MFFGMSILVMAFIEKVNLSEKANIKSNIIKVTGALSSREVTYKKSRKAYLQD